jgi:hypothetical protein
MFCLKKQRKTPSAFYVITTLAVVILLAYPSYGQVAGATLSGKVIDATGAVIPNAQVAIKNVATGIVIAVPTNSDGLYSAPNLLPDNYEVTISDPGFRTQILTGITLTVGAQRVLDVTLQVGANTQQIVVTDAAPTVDLASSSISALVNSNTVVELPLNGRDWTTLAALQPGVNAVPTLQPVSQQSINSGRGNRGFGNQMSISGTRPQLNNYRLDGVSIVDYSGGGPGSAAGVSLGVDAIEEFSVLTANFNAEYGRTSGGVINAITKAGTDQVHGNAYWFLRDEGFDARNYFDSSTLPFHRNQFGASVGGPIHKDKAFFFVDYEGLRQDQGYTNVNIVPSPDARNGIIHNANGTITTLTVDPLVKPFLGFYALPNAGLIGVGNTGHFDAAVNNMTSENFVTNRIDLNMSEKDRIFGTWLYDSASVTAPDSLDTQLTGNTSFRLMIDLEETHVFNPSLVNTVRGGYSRVHDNSSESLQAFNPLMVDTTLGAIPGRNAPAIAVTGLTTFNGGLNGLSSPHYIWNSFQAYDDASAIKGAHSFKMGFAFERIQSDRIGLSLPNGQTKFGSLNNFLTNQPNSFQAPLQGSSGIQELRQSILGAYFQDDWRLRPNLTLNLGLRYEIATVPTENQNKLTNLPTFTSPTPHLGSPFFNNPTLRNFEPRIGFAWDPLHDGKTAVRGAFGIFDALPLTYEFYAELSTATPFEKTITASQLPQGSFPNLQFTDASAKSLSAGSILSPRRNYVMIWNLNVQRQLTASTTMMLGYVGNHGVHMLNRADDVNDVLPTQTPQGLLWPSPVGSGNKINPAFGAINGLYYGGDAEYDALVAQVVKKMSHGFQVQGSYTWGKGIDTGSASVLGNPFTNSISSLFWFCRTCRRGLSDFNITQTLVVNYIWDVPITKSLGTIGTHVLGGWEVGGIITAETGVPFTPLIGGDPLGLNNTDPFAFPNRLTGPGCNSAVNPGNPQNYVNLSCFSVPMATPSIAAQCTPFKTVPGSCSNLLGNAGRNSVIGPGLVTWDFSLFKNNYIKRISDSFNVQFRAEFFNILNRPNFAVPTDNQTFFAQDGSAVGGAGSVDQTSTTARQIQFALKVIW